MLINISFFFFCRFNLNPLRRLTNNYVVENQNRRFEFNICGRLNKNKCEDKEGNITTICDITDIKKPKVYAVENRKNNQLYFDSESRSLKLIQGVFKKSLFAKTKFKLNFQ